MKKFIRTYFYFTRREKNGILILILLIGIVFLLPSIIAHFQKNKVWDYSSFEEQINRFQYGVMQAEKEAHPPVECFYFDPNTLPENQFKKLGFTEKQTRIIVNYRKAGGHFNQADDLKKIYGIPDTLYRRIAPFIKIASPLELVSKNKSGDFAEGKNQTKEIEKNRKKERVAELRIDLNTADSSDLLKISGIGPVFANRIMAYRNYLGGFYQVDQLTEVYGLDAEKVAHIASQVYIDTSKIHKIDLNNCDFKQLNKHPYFTYAQTKAIFKYKKLMGAFAKADELVSQHLIDSSDFNKVKHYLMVR